MAQKVEKEGHAWAMENNGLGRYSQGVEPGPNKGLFPTLVGKLANTVLFQSVYRSVDPYMPANVPVFK